MTDDVRFWQKVKKSDGCWLYTGAHTKLGYGWVGRDGKQTRAHRHSWVLHFGPIADGLYVLHKCDVRDCVNPAHLYLGTHADNMRDKKERGRHGGAVGGDLAVGAKNVNAKLTDEKVREILKKISNGVKISAIVEEYGISSGTAYNVKNRRVWRHVDGGDFVVHG